MIYRVILSKNCKNLFFKCFAFSILINTCFCIINNIFDFYDNGKMLTLMALGVFKVLLSICFGLYVCGKNKNILLKDKNQQKI